MPIPTITGEFLIGHEPRFSVGPSGSPVCGLWLLSSDSKKNPDGTYTRTREFPVEGVIFGGLAEYAGNLVKNDVVIVTGRVHLDEYNGVKKPKMFIDAIGKKGGGTRKDTANAAPADDPWASAPKAQGSYSDEPPF